MTASHDEPNEMPGETAPSCAAPRMARYGEVPEGRPARRERDLDEHPRDGFFERLSKFVRDVRAELGRTSWPSATQVKNTTIITIIAVIFFAAYLYVVDQLFSRGLGWLASLFGAA